jgi:type IV secretion system protein VirB4
LRLPFGPFDPRVRVYQALFKTNEPAIPHQQYGNPLVKAAIDQRMAYFASKADKLYSIDLYWTVLVQGSHAKSTVWQALAKLPTDIGGSLRDVRALFSQGQQRMFLRAQIRSRSSALAAEGAEFDWATCLNRSFTTSL